MYMSHQFQASIGARVNPLNNYFHLKKKLADLFTMGYQVLTRIIAFLSSLFFKQKYSH